jgi:hypothetical protein
MTGSGNMKFKEDRPFTNPEVAGWNGECGRKAHGHRVRQREMLVSVANWSLHDRIRDAGVVLTGRRPHQ